MTIFGVSNAFKQQVLKFLPEKLDLKRHQSLEISPFYHSI